MKLHPIRLLPFIIILLLASARLRSQSDFWRQLDIPYGGSATAIAVDPRGNIFATFYGDGFFRSTDHGASWSSIRKAINARTINAIAIDSAGTLFAVEIIGWRSSVYRSTDRGESWTAFTDTADYILRSIASTPKNHLFARSDTSLLRSTDGGTTWSPVGHPPLGIRLSGMAINRHGVIFVAANKGIFRITDDGETWQRITLDAPGDGSMYFVMTGPGTEVYARGEHGSIFRSDDDGITWIQLLETLPNDYNIYGAIDSAGTILLGSERNDILRSTDRGITWTHTVPYIKGLRVNAIAADGDGFLAGAGMGGIFRSTDHGISWRPSKNGLAAMVVMAVTTTPSGTLLIATDGDGIYRSEDGGTSWRPSGEGLGTSYFDCFARDAGGALLAGGFGVIYGSIDDGRSWTGIPIDNFELRGTDIDELAVMPDGEMIAVTQQGTAYRSSKGRTTWKQLEAPLTGLVWKAAFTLAGTGLVSTFNGLFRSTDGGSAWYAITDWSDYWTPYDFAIDSSGAIYCNTLKTPRRSTDDGKTWEEFGDIAAPMSMAVAPTNELYIATASGFYRSGDRGNTLVRITEELPRAFGTFIIGADRYAYMATYGAGLYRSSVAVAAAPAEDRGESGGGSIASYPNPIDRSGSIGFTLRAAGRTRLSIYDINGAEVARPVDGIVAGGYHRIPFDASALPCGLYTCVITSGGTTIRGRMTVVR